jgi:hypothetical protein
MPFLAVFVVAGHVPQQHLLLVENTPRQDWNIQEEDRHCQPRSKCYWCEQIHDQETQVHRVADDGIRTCGDDFLTLHYLNYAGCVAVLFKDPENETVAKEHSRISRSAVIFAHNHKIVAIVVMRIPLPFLAVLQ